MVKITNLHTLTQVKVFKVCAMLRFHFIIFINILIIIVIIRIILPALLNYGLYFFLIFSKSYLGKNTLLKSILWHFFPPTSALIVCWTCNWTFELIIIIIMIFLCEAAFEWNRSKRSHRGGAESQMWKLDSGPIISYLNEGGLHIVLDHGIPWLINIPMTVLIKIYHKKSFVVSWGTHRPPYTRWWKEAG